MGAKCWGGRTLLRLLRNRRGTAEIVGSVLFLVILFFVFTNVYLWHEQATRQMDNVVLNKVNSPVSIEIVNMSSPTGVLKVTNKGGVGFSLSRLWIITSDSHNYASFEKDAIWLAGGDTVNIILQGENQTDPDDGSYLVGAWTTDGVRVYYKVPSVEVKVTFKILTTLGNTAACRYSPSP